SERPSTPAAADRIRQVTAKNLQRLGYRRIIQLLIYLIIVPTVLLLSLGIILLFVEGRTSLLFGILTVSFVSVVFLGIVLVLVFVRREANLSELQADFVSKVSHELRTPLTAIRLFAETLQRADTDVATREKCTSLLVAESERLSKMIERLLDWGRMEAGRKIYELRREKVADVIEDALRAYAPHQQLGADLDFGVEVTPDPPDVVVDRVAIVGAIVNLLSNAQKYGGSPPRVRLSVVGTDETVTIAVTDNGGGIPRPEHRRIFEKFYRIDDRLSRTKEGSGLGLAIVNHVARAHRARVTVESAEGKGSTFALVLPALPRAEEDSNPKAQSSRALSSTTAAR
ncbi:MAG TPA: HAMP domain-containing sensor histidine kinase, partial [Labilithrix sp.]|nr:HAMP domain-containing sensor histidine kinase [Labilithrix sp.]